MLYVLVLLVLLGHQAHCWCQVTTIQEPGSIVQVDYAHNNLYFVTANSNGYVNIYNASTYQILSQFNNSGKIPSSVKFSKNSAYIGIGYRDTSTLQVLNGAPPFGVFRSISTGLNGANPTVGEVDFRYDNSEILACGDDRIKSFYLSNGNVNINTNPSGGGSQSLACRYSASNMMALSYANRKVFIFDASGSQISSTTYNDVVNQFDFKPATNNYYSAIQNNSVQVNSSVVFTDSSGVETISYSKLGNIIAFGGRSNKLYIINSTYSQLDVFSNYAATIQSVKISPDQQAIITGDASGKVRIYAKTCQIKCQAGQYNNSNVCTKCSDLFSYCSKCTSAACAMCSPGYWMNGGSCVGCSNSLTGCLACNTSAICVNCLDGYYLTVSNTCSLCIGIMEACITCNTSLICTQCLKNQYYLDTVTSKCLKCTSINNCVKCYNISVCVQCQVGFYSDATGICQQCTPNANCLVCQSSTNCTQCKVGYYASTGTCTRCSTSCLQCNQTGACYECQEGWFLTATNTCSQCLSPCLTCFGTSLNCTQCLVSGFYYSGSNVCTACNVNCQTCNSTVTCLSCYVGYIYNGAGPNCLACSSSYPNCSQCTSLICQACQKGFYLDGSNLCKTCNTMAFCVQCASSTNCTQCSIGFFHSGGTGATSCSGCPLGCQQCISSTNCTNCAISYFRNTSNLCSPCPSYCVQCQTNSFCYSCQIGYFIDATTANLCVSCQTTLNYCKTCLNSTNCLSCMMGTYLDATFKCQFCSPNCLTCNLTDCQSCQVGYFLGGTPKSCTKCNQFCKQCSSSGNCLGCINNYYLNTTDSSCRNCSLIYPHCQQCNQAICLRCSFGYALNSTNVCVSCQASINKCTKCNINSVATLICQQCTYGFYLSTNNLTCLSCNSISGCLACRTSLACIKCQVGFYLKADSTCGVCNYSCLSCSNAATCLDCKKGWIWDVGTNQCQLCQSYIQGCQSCSYGGSPVQLQCNHCINGYYLFTDNQCYLCQNSLSGCYFCNDSSICTFCLDSYYKKTDNTCATCSVIQGCQLCNTSAICLECQSGYFLTPANICQKCMATMPGCLYCSDLSHCLECQNSYYLDVGSICQLCQSQLNGCIYCNDIATCIQCRSGYYLDGGSKICLPCTSQGCQICLQSLPSKCVTCNTGYYLDSSNNCFDCDALQRGCVLCNNSMCSDCDIGYYLTSGNLCSLCSTSLQGCSICSSSLACLQCKSGYYVNASNKCEECSIVLTGCQYCINSSSCLSCQVNFYLNSTTNFCSPCTSLYGCVICQNQTNCVLCDTRYYLNGISCQSCSVILGCFDCISNTVCIQCQNGYVLDSTTYKCVSNQVQQKLPVYGLKLVSYYVDKNTLKHILYAKNYTFSPTSTNITANGFTKLQIAQFSGKTIDLTIKSYQFGKNGYSLILYTNNPLGSFINQSTGVYSFTRRLLLATPTQNAFQINLNVNLNMDETIYNEILPQLSYSGSLGVSYNMNDPQFYKSYLEANSDYFFYQFFGFAIIGMLLVNYALKYFKTCKRSTHRGQLFTHIVSIKACCLILYPTYFEYINFCSGFMITDFPWLNNILSDLFVNKSDDIAIPFSLFYNSMGIFGTFLLGLAAYLFFYLVGLAYFSGTQKKQKSVQSESNDSDDFKSQQIKLENVQKQIGINYKVSSEFLDTKQIVRRNYFEFLYNIFCFGMIFFSCVAFQGALLNPSKIFDLNGLNYIIGILIYVGVVIEGFYSFFRNYQFINKLRLLFKVSLLSLGHINPIYMVSLCTVLDSALIYVQFFVIRKRDDWRTHYTILNGLCNLNLILLIFVPQYKLCLFIVAASLLFCLLLQVFLHYKQYKKDKQNPNFWDKNKNQLSKIQNKQNTTEGLIQNYTKRGNIWNLNQVKDNLTIHMQQPNEETWYNQKSIAEVMHKTLNITQDDNKFGKNQKQVKIMSRNRKSRLGESLKNDLKGKKPSNDKKSNMVQTSIKSFTFEEQDLDQ